MQVFNAYFKIIKKNLPQISIYIVVFMTLAIILTLTNTQEKQIGFSDSKINIAFLNNDKAPEGSLANALNEGLRNYLSQSANIIPMDDDREKLQDALFFRKIEYIVRVPSGFSSAFIKKQTGARIEKISVPGSTASIYTDLQINKYLNTARLYINSIKDINSIQLAEYINKSLNVKVHVAVKTYGAKTERTDITVYYFNYIAYIMLSVLILGVSTCMIVFNETDIRRRNLCAPLSLKSRNLQMIAANLVFAIVCWLLTVILSLALYRGKMLTINALYLYINSFLFTLTCLSISYLAGSALKNKNAQSAVSNVITMVMCFTGGVFVPQVFLGDTVLIIARFTPVYWYVKANTDIVSIYRFTPGNVMPVIYSMLLQLGFSAAILAIALVITKQKRVSYNGENI